MPRRLLIIESQPLSSAHDTYFNKFSLAGLAERVDWGPSLPDVIRQKQPELLILVAVSAHEEATAALSAFQKRPFLTPTLAILPKDAREELICLASRIVDDFILAPIHMAELEHRIGRIIGHPSSAVDSVDERLIREFTLAGLIGQNPAFLREISKIPVAARTRGPVLITGETGTGKELCARAIHNLGPRRNDAFIPVDCATLPEHLFESEMFGHIRGAFTDARSDHKGLVNLAHGGTLFLDEIDSLSLPAQSKLLRLLQERSYRPVGSERFINFNASIIAATNTDLKNRVEAGQFRADLFFRLNVLRLNLIPLRQRRDDVASLSRHFVEQVCFEHGIATRSLSPATLRKLSQHDWPGNVRELYNVIQRAVLFSRGSDIVPADILDTEETTEQDDGRVYESFREARSRAIESFERKYVEQLMHEADGNVSRAARLAHKERRAFGKLVKRYGLKN